MLAYHRRATRTARAVPGPHAPRPQTWIQSISNPLGRTRHAAALSLSVQADSTGWVGATAHLLSGDARCSRCGGKGDARCKQARDTSQGGTSCNDGIVPPEGHVAAPLSRAPMRPPARAGLPAMRIAPVGPVQQAVWANATQACAPGPRARTTAQRGGRPAGSTSQRSGNLQQHCAPACGCIRPALHTSMAVAAGEAATIGEPSRARVKLPPCCTVGHGGPQSQGAPGGHQLTNRGRPYVRSAPRMPAGKHPPKSSWQEIRGCHGVR